MNGKAVAGAVLGILFLATLVVATLPASLIWPATPPDSTEIGVVLWTSRTFEVLLQAILLLGGVVAILLILEATLRREVAA